MARLKTRLSNLSRAVVRTMWEELPKILTVLYQSSFWLQFDIVNTVVLWPLGPSVSKDPGPQSPRVHRLTILGGF